MCTFFDVRILLGMFKCCIQTPKNVQIYINIQKHYIYNQTQTHTHTYTHVQGVDSKQIYTYARVYIYIYIHNVILNMYTNKLLENNIVFIFSIIVFPNNYNSI